MKWFAMMIGSWWLVSCVHTAIAPVCTPQGEIAVIRIPKAPLGQVPGPDVMKPVYDKIGKGMEGQGPAGRQGEGSEAPPGLLDIGLVGPVGDLKTKRGERFVGWVPMVVIRSTLPADQVDRAAGVIAAAAYRSARKSFDVYSAKDLEKLPEKKP